jgi:hypothetical protein
MRTRTTCLALVFAALVGFAAPAHAVPITYTETAIATGMLDGTNFTNALVTITGTGDTATAPTGVVGIHFYFPFPGVVTVTVTGVGVRHLVAGGGGPIQHPDPGLRTSGRRLLGAHHVS